MSTVSWLLEATMYYMVGRAFGIDVGFEYYSPRHRRGEPRDLRRSRRRAASARSSWSPSRRSSPPASATSAATAYAIGLHALVLLPVIVLGLYFLGTMDLSLGEMFRRSRRASEAACRSPKRCRRRCRREEVPGS